ncbi:MAG: hypothetical protein PHP69_00815 [Candidatus Omnitrophica bacterium]|nr:hypothetical protein [Candidatus Omnitrophota bacterium]MDD5080949.1 hypothetical protein [Candidatus Omnitrophota bacterium]MDD5440592.1 hypothetical protein [Candidatus Omnitrophota bacterium]
MRFFAKLFIQVIFILVFLLFSKAYSENNQVVLVSSFTLMDTKTPIFMNLEKDFSNCLADRLKLMTNYTVLTDISKSKLAYSNISDEIILTGDILNFQPGVIDTYTGKKVAYIEVEVQLINAKKGTVISTKRISARVPESQYSLGYSGQWSIKSSDFSRTSLGKAYSAFINQTIIYVKETLK